MTNLDQLALDNPFWQFSLAQWKNKPLQQQLLSLQDSGNYRINLLLLSMWLSFDCKDIQPHYPSLVYKSSTWHDQIVSPIRNTRKALSAELSTQSHSLKTQLQACELQAEQIEQALLYEASLNIPRSISDQFDSLDWLISNLSASGLAKSDLSLLIQNCLPTYPVDRINERLQAFKRTL